MRVDLLAHLALMVWRIDVSETDSEARASGSHSLSQPHPVILDAIPPVLGSRYSITNTRKLTAINKVGLEVGLPMRDGSGMVCCT